MVQNHDRYKGLSDADVIRSRGMHGANLLNPPARTPLWKQFLRKFRDPLIIILMVAGVLSVGIACYEHWGLGLGSDVFLNLSAYSWRFCLPQVWLFTLR